MLGARTGRLEVVAECCHFQVESFGNRFPVAERERFGRSHLKPTDPHLRILS